MKTLKLLTLILVIFSFAGCKDELFDITFGLNTKDATFTIQPTSKAGAIVLIPTSQSLNLDSLAKANGADISKIKSVKIKKITAMIENPATGNFDILDSGFVNISVGIIGDPDFELLRIASFSGVPKGVKQFDITPTDKDVLLFAKKPKLTVSGTLYTNGPVLEATTIKIKIEFEVVASPLAK